METPDPKNFIVYQGPSGAVAVSAYIKDETIWLTQKEMAELFGVDVPAINKHLKNIFMEGELQEKATISILEIVRIEGNRHVKRKQSFYNLDAIISVGYRVNSRRATHFRIWATKVLKEYMRKGFVLDDKRLKQGEDLFGKDYFRELLERVRSIRASERRIWQQITDIFAECSRDYDKDSQEARDFYAEIQNRFHYAITGMTAPELIHSRADSTKMNMGLCTWKNAQDGRKLKSDSITAKNYLTEKELRKLERSVSNFFDYIEELIENENTFDMKSFSEAVNRFLEFHNYKILHGKGKVSRAQANAKATTEYDKYNRTQKIDSDFDKQVRRIMQDKKD